jgi:hypothetical protein
MPFIMPSEQKRKGPVLAPHFMVNLPSANSGCFESGSLKHQGPPVGERGEGEALQQNHTGEYHDS